VTRADLEQTVSSTGTLEAVTTVEVGTQVSGSITRLLVDYNDDVEAGQLLAQIDPTLLSAEVDSARASLAEERAAATLADQELARTIFQADHGAASQQDLDVARAGAAQAAARVRSAQVALSRAERNLGYATIVSPIDGTVLDRLVEVGQTVNAGTSTPTLYTLAGDLEQMQILATVDEADIGLLSPGQAVSFTVQAWPERSFEGAVRQVRLQSTTTDSVVTYTAVVDVPNGDRLLLPGMTASVDFVVASVDDALTAPASALRFEPGSGAGPDDAGDAVWTTDASGRLVPIPVQVGLSDGRNTQVTGEGLTEGTTVVTGQLASGSGGRGSSSPFQSEGEQRRGPGGPGAF
jgi:HlyD family secretion protein